MNSLGDIITSTKSHECAVCHYGVQPGDVVQAGAYDALTWPRVVDAVVWLHMPCAALHTEVAHRTPLYTAGWLVIDRPQSCARCGAGIHAQGRAWRVVDAQHQVYVLVCQDCREG